MSNHITFGALATELNAVIKVTSSSARTFYFRTIPDTRFTKKELQAYIAQYLSLFPLTLKEPVNLITGRVSIVFVYPNSVSSTQEYIFGQGITHLHIKLPSLKEKEERLKKEACYRLQSQINALKFETDRLEKHLPIKQAHVADCEKEPNTCSQEPSFDHLYSQVSRLRKRIKGIKDFALIDVIHEESS